MSIRQQLRAARSAIPETSRQQSNQLICQQLPHVPALSAAQTIACYFSVGGEVDLTDFIAWIHQTGRTCMLPVLDDSVAQSAILQFAPFAPNTPLKPNRFGIMEPDVTKTTHIAAEALDAVLMPLVGFSPKGDRLGMGGGFYDRTFAFRLKQSAPPILIGVAFECQKSESFLINPWDVPCDLVITDQSSYHPS